MLPNTSITAPDTGFDARWAAWRVRGAAHERAVRRKLILTISFAGMAAIVAAIAYTLLHR